MTANKCSTVADMGDRFATIDMAKEVDAVPHSEGEELSPHLTQYSLGRDVPPY